MKNSGYTVPRTDLATEKRVKEDEYCEYMLSGLRVTDISFKKGADMSKKEGRYVTVHCPVMRYLDYGEADAVAEAVAHVLRELCEETAGKEIGSGFKALVAGIGNRFITSDAIGPKTADKISVTGFGAGKGNYLGALNCAGVCAVHPGVRGQTGIETAEVIRGTARQINPDVVVVVDALAARSVERLASTVQLTNTGISPGAGIGKRRSAIDRESIGYPVITVGVPTVVDSATLVFDALERAGIDGVSDEFVKNLYEGSFFVSVGDGDIITDEVSTILASAIDRAFYTEGIQAFDGEYKSIT